jgi:hypothetical protein
VLAETLNTERMPWEHYTDLRISKYFSFWSVFSTLYLRVLNVFDVRNVLRVYAETGKWDINYGEPRHLTANPNRISDGRKVRLGLKIDF